MDEAVDAVYKSGRLHFTLSLSSYRIAAVKKTGYRLAARCTTVLGAVDGDRLALTLLFGQDSSEEEAMDTLRAFFQELLDQELREQLAEETAATRTLILAHAFSKTGLIDHQS